MRINFQFFVLGLCLIYSVQAFATTYLTQEQSLALTFKEPSTAKRHELLFDDAHRKAIEKKLNEPIKQNGILAYTGELKSGGKGIVLFDAVIGKHQLIDYMVVLNEEGKIQSIEILAYRESYGEEIRQDSWRKQFTDKSEKEPPEHNKNIVNISGATLSCRHITEGVRKLLAVASVYAKELEIKAKL